MPQWSAAVVFSYSKIQIRGRECYSHSGIMCSSCMIFRHRAYNLRFITTKTSRQNIRAFYQHRTNIACTSRLFGMNVTVVTTQKSDRFRCCFLCNCHGCKQSNGLLLLKLHYVYAWHIQVFISLPLVIQKNYSAAKWLQVCSIRLVPGFRNIYSSSVSNKI